MEQADSCHRLCSLSRHIPAHDRADSVILGLRRIHRIII